MHGDGGGGGVCVYAFVFVCVRTPVEIASVRRMNKVVLQIDVFIHACKDALYDLQNSKQHLETRAHFQSGSESVCIIVVERLAEEALILQCSCRVQQPQLIFRIGLPTAA